MRKRNGLIVALAVVFAFATGVVAKNVFDVIRAEVRTDFVIEIDGEERVFKNVDGERVYPILHNGTTYLPVRAIGEILGKDVYWYEAEKRIEFKDKKKEPTVTDADVIVEDGKKEKPAKSAEKAVIGKEKAKKIALDKANLKESEVSFVKIELDRDDGIWKYEVEFRKGLREYSADIKADDGKILDWEADFDD